MPRALGASADGEIMAAHIKLEITKTGINGEGIGYYHDRPVFVPGAFSEETILADITADKGTYCQEIGRAHV